MKSILPPYPNPQLWGLVSKAQDSCEQYFWNAIPISRLSFNENGNSSYHENQQILPDMIEIGTEINELNKNEYVECIEMNPIWVERFSKSLQKRKKKICKASRKKIKRQNKKNGKTQYS